MMSALEGGRDIPQNQTIVLVISCASQSVTRGAKNPKVQCLPELNLVGTKSSNLVRI